MKAIILNYASGCVETAELPEDLFIDDESGRDESEKVEEYLSLELGYHLDEINYMTTEGDCNVYSWDGREPYATI